MEVLVKSIDKHHGASAPTTPPPPPKVVESPGKLSVRVGIRLVAPSTPSFRG
jgi:hypothetical protein